MLFSYLKSIPKTIQGIKEKNNVCSKITDDSVEDNKETSIPEIPEDEKSWKDFFRCHKKEMPYVIIVLILVVLIASEGILRLCIDDYNGVTTFANTTSAVTETVQDTPSAAGTQEKKEIDRSGYLKLLRFDISDVIIGGFLLVATIYCFKTGQFKKKTDNSSEHMIEKKSEKDEDNDDGI